MDEVTVRRGYNNNTVSWDEAFYNLNDSICKHELIKQSRGFFVSHNAERISLVQDVLNDLKCQVAHLYIGIDITNPGFGNHNDDVDVSIGYGTTSETTVAGSLTTEGGIFINNDSYLNIVNTGGYGVRINYTSGTANITVTFPDAAGTIALTSDITSDGWHGSTTRIKILPRDFVANDIGRPIMIEDDSVGSNELFLFSFSSGDMFAYVPIPTGYKATHVRIYGSDATQDFYVYEGDINSKTIADVATGSTSIGTEKTLGTEVTSDTTNYLIVRVTSDGATDEVHGGYVTIAAV